MTKIVTTETMTLVFMRSAMMRLPLIALPQESKLYVFLISEIVNVANGVKNKHSHCEHGVELLPYLDTNVDFQSF